MKITVTAKVDEDVVMDLERMADSRGITRSQLVAWAIKRGLDDLKVRLDQLDVAGVDIPGLPPEVRAS